MDSWNGMMISRWCLNLETGGYPQLQHGFSTLQGFPRELLSVTSNCPKGVGPECHPGGLYLTAHSPGECILAYKCVALPPLLAGPGVLRCQILGTGIREPGRPSTKHPDYSSRGSWASVTATGTSTLVYSVKLFQESRVD